MNLCIFIRTIAGNVWQLSAGLGEGAIPRHPASGKRRQQAAMERKLQIPSDACRDKHTRNFVEGNTPAKFQHVEKQIWKTLEALDGARSMQELRRKGGLRFEKLKYAKWQYSVRVNDTYRICFDWRKKSPHPTNIEINNHYGN